MPSSLGRQIRLIPVIPDLIWDPVSYKQSSIYPTKRWVIFLTTSGFQERNLCAMEYGRFVVYILTNRRNGALYIGITRDIVRRLEEHRAGTVAGFVSKHRLHQLVHAEFFTTAVEAIAREKQLKAWRRRWKVELIEAGNPYWRDLSREL